MPITAKVRDEAWEAGQTRASGRDEGDVVQSVNRVRSIFPTVLVATTRIGLRVCGLVRFLFLALGRCLTCWEKHFLSFYSHICLLNTASWLAYFR